LAAGIALLGATTPMPGPTASPFLDARCPHAIPAVESYDALAKDPDLLPNGVIAAALDASAAYDKCATFAATRGNLEGVHYAQVRSATYHYDAGGLYFASDDYAQARRELGIARALVQDTLAWPKTSLFRADALALRDAADALLAKIPVPTGLSTAPAITPATSAPK
jgi:hypothetical protein